MREFAKVQPSEELAATVQYIVIAGLIGPKKASRGLGDKAGKYKGPMQEAVRETVEGSLVSWQISTFGTGASKRCKVQTRFAKGGQ